jgi:hypothetical protein
MVSDFFANSRAKFDRACKQLDDLYADLMVALDPEKYPIVGDIDHQPYPKPEGITDPRPWFGFTLFITSTPTFNDDHGLLLGEVLHNFRGSLDHLAWELVRRTGRKRLHASEKKAVAFPMTKSRKSYWGKIKGKGRVDVLLPDVPRKPYRTLIERYQPYRRSSAGRAMKRLRDLTDTDKHRVILPTLVLPQSGDLNLKYEGAEPVAFIHHLRFGWEIKQGTKIMTLVLAGGEPGKRKVSVEGRVTSTAFFPRSILRPPKGESAVLLEVALNEIRATCEQVRSEIRNEFENP